MKNITHYRTGINQSLKLSWQITNNSKNHRDQNNNENKMMITTDVNKTIRIIYHKLLLQIHKAF